MKKKLFAFAFALVFHISILTQSQSLYFPPLSGLVWDTISPVSLGWCPAKIDSLENYLAQKNTKAFIVLKGGKIAIEKYFGSFTKDSIWYWASAGKSLTGFLTGVAQEENLLTINDSVSRFLGNGWTSCLPQKERLITIKNQLSMSTGLDDSVPDDNCIIDTCLNYLTDAGTRWAYHNAPFHLVQEVISNASSISYNTFTNTKIKSKIGMQGFWFDYIYYSRARDMARFGLVIQNKGIWNSDTLLHDTSYFNAMISTSQNYNLSYGYLWWLNGKSSFMVPQSQLVFPGNLIPNAPSDAFAALGKNDQKIYIVPSLDLVVIRMGNASGAPLFAVSSFDNEVWGKLNDVFCGASTQVIENPSDTDFYFYPNPASESIEITVNKSHLKNDNLFLYDALGREVFNEPVSSSKIKLTTSQFKSGIYFLRIGNSYKKVVLEN